MGFGFVYPAVFLFTGVEGGVANADFSAGGLYRGLLVVVAVNERNDFLLLASRLLCLL